MNDIYQLTAERVLDTLPQVLQEDATCFAIAQAIAGKLVKLSEDAEELRIYSAIDNLPESLLDILAVDLKIDWWRADDTLANKRDLVKTCWYVHRHLGTKSAIETAVAAFLGQGVVQEWFEYGGEPHHFRVVGAENSAVNEHFDEFMRLLTIVQRGSSVIDSVTATILCSAHAYVATVFWFSTVMEIGCNDVDDAILEIYSDEDVTVLTDENGNILIDERGNILHE